METDSSQFFQQLEVKRNLVVIFFRHTTIDWTTWTLSQFTLTWRVRILQVTLQATNVYFRIHQGNRPAMSLEYFSEILKQIPEGIFIRNPRFCSYSNPLKASPMQCRVFPVFHTESYQDFTESFFCH